MRVFQHPCRTFFYLLREEVRLGEKDGVLTICLCESLFADQNQIPRDRGNTNVRCSAQCCFKILCLIYLVRVAHTCAVLLPSNLVPISRNLRSLCMPFSFPKEGPRELDQLDVFHRQFLSCCKLPRFDQPCPTQNNRIAWQYHRRNANSASKRDWHQLKPRLPRSMKGPRIPSHSKLQITCEDGGYTRSLWRMHLN